METSHHERELANWSWNNATKCEAAEDFRFNQMTNENPLLLLYQKMEIKWIGKKSRWTMNLEYVWKENMLCIYIYTHIKHTCIFYKGIHTKYVWMQTYLYIKYYCTCINIYILKYIFNVQIYALNYTYIHST